MDRWKQTKTGKADGWIGDGEWDGREGDVKEGTGARGGEKGERSNA